MAETTLPKLEMVALADIRPYENNPRRNDAAVEYVENSIRQFGCRQPIVIDKTGTIVAGHTRYKAMQRLGWQEAPCIRADDLTDEQVRAYRLADNKTAEFSEWDSEMLAAELELLMADMPELDMSVFGFEPAADAEAPEESDAGGEIDIGAGEETECTIELKYSEADYGYIIDAAAKIGRPMEGIFMDAVKAGVGDGIPL
jgi:hypothetical protein